MQTSSGVDEITEGNSIMRLTKEQVVKLVDALQNGTTFSKHTDDPYVNYLIDCINDGEADEIVDYEEMKEIYEKEIKEVI